MVSPSHSLSVKARGNSNVYQEFFVLSVFSIRIDFKCSSPLLRCPYGSNSARRLPKRRLPWGVISFGPSSNPHSR